jgi:alpha-amylase/alpha-mannosidase (GH57 family)
MSNPEDLKTSEEWQSKYPHVKILDPDGWDRKNYQYSWYEELITREEFEKRMMMSTCMGINPEQFDPTKNIETNG